MGSGQNILHALAPGPYPPETFNVSSACGHSQSPFGLPGDGCELATTRTCPECGALLWWTEQAEGGYGWELFQ